MAELYCCMGGCFAGASTAYVVSEIRRKTAELYPLKSVVVAAVANTRTAVSKTFSRKNVKPASVTKPKQSGAGSGASSSSSSFVGEAANAVRSMLGHQPAADPGRVVDDEVVGTWTGRVWSLSLGPGEETSIEVRFKDDGLHWWVSMKDRGPGIAVTATLVSAAGKQELENDTVQSVHGQTSICRGEGLLKLDLHNAFARVSTRQVEVSVFPFRAGARLGSHDFLRGSMLEWMSVLVNETFLEKKEAQLKADRLEVVEVQRIMHDGLWNRYARNREEIAKKLAQSPPAVGRSTSKKTSVITDHLVPLSVMAAANEHWLFHGSSAQAVCSISEEGFIDNHKVNHGLAFGSGCYFTECSSKADTYATPAEWRDSVDRRGLCCILLCRVVLGCSRVFDSEYHLDKAKLRVDLASGNFHSVLADRDRLLGSYREFVTPALQAYPEFIIWYRREYKSGFQTWKERQWGGDLFG
eukprot:TRINITY_DN80109_c0_g1_i1.p1 TRINITY_DN80109_c0_g1~~TRINITY_DN80109_c0_g1_i1.p1  ORF type:complete len:468 (-),score=76.32 TRINITY_DN80109_c0_g1_i1:57-1460(-)